MYEEVSHGSSTVGRVFDPSNEDAWIQSDLTVPVVGPYGSE